MGKKKRKFPQVEELMSRPWCYYCERDFDDLKILISHQKAKHFKCERCGRRLNTAGGLNVHMNQVHKEQLNQVENALPNRKGLDIEIFGMEGVPDDVLQQHQQRVIQNFYEGQRERQLKTGNPPAGSGRSAQPKKPRVESAAELKARLRDFLAQKASGQIGANGMAMDVDSAPAQVCPFFEFPLGETAGGDYALTDKQGSMFPTVAPNYPVYSPTQFAPRQSATPPNVQSFQAPPAVPPRPAHASPPGAPGFMPQPPAQNFDPNLAASVDDLISSAAKAAQRKATPTQDKAQEKTAEKKKKEKAVVQLVFSDSHVLNQEEEISQLPKYAFLKA